MTWNVALHEMTMQTRPVMLMDDALKMMLILLPDMQMAELMTNMQAVML